MPSKSDVKTRNRNARNRPPRLNRAQKIRLQALLDMEYTPRQLADAIGCCRDTVYRGFIPAGCPHRRNDRGHLFINGNDLARWYEKHQPPKRHLEPDEAWCFRCNGPVEMQPPFKVKPTNLYLELVSGTCPNCETTVNRARARKEPK